MVKISIGHPLWPSEDYSERRRGQVYSFERLRSVGGIGSGKEWRKVVRCCEEW